MGRQDLRGCPCKLPTAEVWRLENEALYTGQGANSCRCRRLRPPSPGTHLNEKVLAFHADQVCPKPKEILSSFNPLPCPHPAEGTRLQNHPLSASFVVKGTSPVWHEGWSQSCAKFSRLPTHAARKTFSSLPAGCPNAQTVCFLTLSVTRKSARTFSLSMVFSHLFFFWKIGLLWTASLESCNKGSSTFQRIVLPCLDPDISRTSLLKTA